MKPRIFSWKTDWPNAAVWTIECDDPRVCTKGRMYAYPQQKGRFEDQSDFEKRSRTRELSDCQKRLASNLLKMRNRSGGLIFTEIEFFRGGLHLIMIQRDHERMRSPVIPDVENVLTYSLGPITFSYNRNRRN